MTSIQKFLGHERINTTMVYAQVHNKSVSDNYYSAMSRIEKQLDLVDTGHENIEKVITKPERDQLLLLIDQLAENQGQDSVAQTLEEMRFLLDSSQTDLSSTLTTNENCSVDPKSINALEITGAD